MCSYIPVQLAEAKYESKQLDEICEATTMLEREGYDVSVRRTLLNYIAELVNECENLRARVAELEYKLNLFTDAF